MRNRPRCIKLTLKFPAQTCVDRPDAESVDKDACENPEKEKPPRNPAMQVKVHCIVRSTWQMCVSSRLESLS